VTWQAARSARTANVLAVRISVGMGRFLLRDGNVRPACPFAPLTRTFIVVSRTVLR
jgi:hypothetical protein